MKLRPLSSIDGRITELLLTIPPVPEEYIAKYHKEICKVFGNRNGTNVIKFKDYKPPKNPLEEVNRPGREGYQVAHLQDSDLDFLGKREVVSISGDRMFVEDYVGGYIEQLKSNRTITNSEWAQDPFSILHDGFENFVFLQPMFSRKYSDYSDKFISLQLAMRKNPDMQMLLRPTDILLEGGNVLAGDNFILAGKDMLAYNCLQTMNAKNLTSLPKTEIDLIIDRIKSAYGIDHIVWIGYSKYHSDWLNWINKPSFSFQPAFHIDLFLTMGGKDEEGNQILILGDPNLAMKMAESVMLPESLQISPLALERFEQLDEFFENYERTKPHGSPSFKIIRIPLLIFRDLILSFNNALTEEWAGNKQIFLPDFEVANEDLDHAGLNDLLRVLKQETEKILYSNPCKFTKVQWIGPGIYFRRLAQSRGSLHCITKVLKRSYD